MHCCESGRCFSGHAISPLLVFTLSEFLLHTLLSSDADLLSSDLNLESKRALVRWPMLMLRTTLVFFGGLCKTCFNTTVLLSTNWGVTTSVSAGWLKVKEHLLCSSGKLDFMTPFMWQLWGRGLALLKSWGLLLLSARGFHKGMMLLLDKSTSLPISMVLM